MKRPGIRRSKVRTPQLALAEIRTLMPLPQRRKSLRALFYGWFRSFCARNMKAGL
jgi:hypothetical protein